MKHKKVVDVERPWANIPDLGTDEESGVLQKIWELENELGHWRKVRRQAQSKEADVLVDLEFYEGMLGEVRPGWMQIADALAERRAAADLANKRKKKRKRKTKASHRGKR